MESVCLINLGCEKITDDQLDPPLGLISIASVLHRMGIEVSIVDLAVDSWIPPADVYGFSLYSTNFQAGVNIMQKLKRQYPGAKFVAGGHHPSALPQEALMAGFDAIVCGEGERAIINWLADGTQKIYKVPVELDQLPPLDYSHIRLEKYTRSINDEKSISFQTSRGCPFKCAFCGSIATRFDNRIREFPVKILEAQLKQLSLQNYHYLRIIDDLFGYNRKRVQELGDLWKEYGMKYRCMTRADFVDDEFARLLKQTNCIHVSLGVESGSQKILDLMNKHTTLDEIRNALYFLQNYNIMTRAYLIVGFPGETWETVEETIKFMKENQFDEYVVYTFVPFPGSPVWENPEAYGVKEIKTIYDDYFFINKDKRGYSFCRTENLNPEVVLQMQKYMISSINTPWMLDGKIK